MIVETKRDETKGCDAAQSTQNTSVSHDEGSQRDSGASEEDLTAARRVPICWLLGEGR